ncbi:Uncharacterised protein [Escherichia coli]|nr:Uncharacterised protein [Escherichia coli]
MELWLTVNGKPHLRQRTAGSADPRRGDFPVYLAAGGA